MLMEIEDSAKPPSPITSASGKRSHRLTSLANRRTRSMSDMRGCPMRPATRPFCVSSDSLHVRPRGSVWLGAMLFLFFAAVAQAAPVGLPAEPGVVDVPATDERGMLAMVLLILMASTAALYGGGLLQRTLGHPSMGPADPGGVRPARLRVPRNKVRRRRVRSTQRSRSPKQPHQLSRRICLTSQSKKKRDGPGCRG